MRRVITLDNGPITDRQRTDNGPITPRSLFAKIAAVVCMLVTIGVGNVWGIDQTWNLTTNSYSSISDNTVTWSSTYITAEATKGSGTKVNNYCPTTYSQHRLYNGNTLTITPDSGYSISSIKITATGSGYRIAGTWTNGTADNPSGQSYTTITPTIGTSAVSCAISATCRLTEIKVTYVAASGHSITYECNGATSGCPSNTTGTALPNPLPTPTKTNYSFDGWYDNSSFTGSPVTAGASLSGNITLYAKWSCSATITFTLNPSTNGTYVVHNGNTIGDPVVSSGVAIPHCSQKTFYVDIQPAAGYCLQELTATPAAAVRDPSDMSGATRVLLTYNAGTIAPTISATFQAAHTVTWSAGGETFATQVGPAGKALTDPGTPASETYCDGEKVFVGWTATADYTNASTPPGDLFTSVAGKTIPSGGTTYYAVYADEEGGGGGGSTTVAGTLSTSAPILSGTGWSTNATATYSGPYLKFDNDGYYVQYVAPSGNTIDRFQYTYKLQSSTSCDGHNKTAWWIGDIDFYVSTDGGTNYTKLAAKCISVDSGSGLGSDVAKDYNDLTSGGYNAVKVVFGKTCGNLAIKGLSATSTAPAATYSNYSTSCVTCDNKVNISKGSETNGTFTLSRSGLQTTCDGGRAITVTPTPADHYRVASVTATNPATTGTATVTGPVNGVYTVTYSENSKGYTTVNVTFEAIPTHTITLVPSAPANGTTSLESAGTTSVTLEEGIVCSLWATPNDCYSVSSITITPANGYSELEANGENKWEILGITADLSVAVVYAQRAQYTVTLDAGTGSVTGSTTLTQSNCGNVTLPSASPSEECALEGWTFAGWSRTKVNIETTSAPVLIPAGSYAPTATETLYAVYKQGSGSGDVYWVKVYNDANLTKGDSIIIASDKTTDQDYAMGTTQNSNNRDAVAITRTTDGDTLTNIGSSVARFYLDNGSSSGTWAFYDANLSGYLCAASSSNNYLRTKAEKDGNSSWSVDIASATGIATIQAQGSYTNNLLKKNNTSALFSCYSSGQKAVCMYKRASAERNNYLSIPSCIPCVSSGASLSSNAVSMTVGKTTVITLTSANTSSVTATSGDASVATVSVSGKDITINGIAQGETTITVQQARDAVDESGHCEVYFEIAVSVTISTIEIIEWEPEAVIIEYDGADDATLILGKEVEHGSKDAIVATELFFSKYFEAAGEDKLLGIFNGTNETIDLTNYSIKDNLGTNDAVVSLDLSTFGQTPGQIAPKEEIILYRYGSTGYSEACMDTIEGHETWNNISWAGMKFSGRHSIGLYKNSTLIDIIGATYSTAVGGHSAGDMVVLNKSTGSGNNGIAPSWGDESGFNAESCGDNIDTKDIETNYGLSTNRCLLIRKNTVTSGENAVTKNKTSYNPDDNPSECAAAFVTMCEEWAGLHVPTTEDKETATCHGMGYVAGFDYSDYYVTMETFSDDTEISDYSNGDGTYTLPIPHMDTLTCRLIRIRLSKEGNVVASSDPQVPIIVNTNKSTNDALFYQHSIDTCKTCDVVVRDGATLTKAANGASNDRPELNSITVYSGSHLVIPSTGATNMVVSNIILRSLEDTVSTASFPNSANGIQFKDKGFNVYHSKRVKQDRWYWMCLPYACQTNKVTWQDGSKASIGTDWHLKYYDGAQRAATQAGGCWKEYTGSTIQPGVGYILSVEQRVGHTHRELIFPMDTISEGDSNKDVPVDDYGAGEDITPNHKGWNLVGNPYMTYYQKNKINAGDKNLPALSVGKLHSIVVDDPQNPLLHLHTYEIVTDGSNNAPFITVPKDNGDSEYEQVLLMDYDLPPFISYFVQIGNNTPVAEQQYVQFARADLTNTTSSLIPPSYIRKRVQEEPDASLETVLVTLHLQNGKQESDETTLLISDVYSKDYEIGSDLGKMFGEKYKERSKPICYSKAVDGTKLAFQSLPDSSATEWIPVGFWGHDTNPITVSVRRQNRKLDYVESVMLYDQTLNTYTELLEKDYTFTPAKQGLFGSRLYVKAIVKRPSPSIATGVNEAHAGMYVYANGSRQLVVVGLPERATVWIYDALGHLIACEQTSHYMRTYALPGAGVYFVRVNNEEGQRTLRAIVK